VLIIAAEAGHIEVVRVLLRHGMATASVSAQARNQRTDHGVYQRQQLDHALANKDMPVLRSLLQADADTPDANGDRLLMRTVKRADIGAVTVLVEAIRQASIGASTWVDEANDQGETALMRATAAGNAGMVRLLLAAGADVTLDNAQDVLLGLALDARDLDTIRLLLAAGADVPDPGGDYALMQAISLNNADWVDLLLQAGASMQGGNWSPLELAVGLNRTEMVRMLLAAGVPLPDAETARVSLLESARRFGNNDMEQLLLAAKKDGTS
jgi:ankyrin repeat protein